MASFSDALRSALREDPDVILVGEMRDYETISLAMTAAETGHLVLATLHTSGAAQTIDRIIDACPPHAHDQVRSKTAHPFQGVVSPPLIPNADGTGRVAALEILIGTDAVKSQIRANKIPQMESVMQAGARQGMCTFQDHLVRLYKRNVISYETAMEYASDKAEMEKALNMTAGF